MILAIETSCDETSVAVLDGDTIRSNVLFSQVNSHRQYGGVVPELASRLHAEYIDQLIRDALDEASISFSDLRYVAVTVGPGLEGALLVGITAANTLAQFLGIPIIPVNHLHGHIYAVSSVDKMVFPTMVCLASGGHTMIIYMKDHLEFELIANTMDDACGECFDKVARMLNLPYPGGPHVEKLALSGAVSVPFPHPIKHNLEAFSFSGLKTAVLTSVKSGTASFEDIAASIQHRISTVLSHKLKLAMAARSTNQLILCGGVFANQAIRQHILDTVLVSDVLIPSPKLCTDNAAMIALAAKHYILSGYFCDQYYLCHPQMGLSFPEVQ